MICGSLSKTSMSFFFFFFMIQGEELHWPIDSRQQLFSHEGGQASGKKRAGGSGEDDDD